MWTLLEQLALVNAALGMSVPAYAFCVPDFNWKLLVLEYTATLAANASA